MRALGPSAVELLPRGATRERVEPGPDAPDRRAVYRAALLWQSPPGGRTGSEPQTCPALDAADGNRGDLSPEADDVARSRSQDLPLFIAECGDRATRPGVEHGHHLRAASGRL